MELQERMGLLEKQCSELQAKLDALILRTRLAGSVILAGVVMALLGYLWVRFS
jgi:hypothetical protein